MKNIKQVARQVARDNGWPEHEVMEEAFFLMQRLKSLIIGMHEPAIRMPRIGAFIVRQDKLRDNILFTIAKIRFYRDSPRCTITGEKRAAILHNYEQMLQRQLAARRKVLGHYMKLKDYYDFKRKRHAARVAKQAENAASGNAGAQNGSAVAGLVDTNDVPSAARTLSMDSLPQRAVPHMPA
jgi:hypothetical protein